MSIYSIATIKAEAIAAAHNRAFKTINDACPYPFADEAVQIFKKYFEIERANIEHEAQATTGATA